MDHDPLRRVLFVLWLLVPTTLYAAPLKPDRVPEPLKPWVEWALHGEEQKTCPFTYNNEKQHYCAWPSELQLELDTRQGQFEQRWQVHSESWAALPGSPKHWPQSVKVDGQPAVVLNRGGRPTLKLAAGTHTVEGRFTWDRLPESLSIPRTTGLVGLKIKNRTVPFPNLDTGGRLWLRERDTDANKTKLGDRVEVQVYRRIGDSIPMQITTRLDLTVSGTQREIVLGPVLLTEAIPLKLKSTLPVRLEADGRLRIQVRPGRWQIDLVVRFPDPRTQLSAPETGPPWPKDEVWVLDARNALRLVEVQGVTPIDPRQTNLPKDWKDLPAYRMGKGEVFSLKILRRGDPSPEPNALKLQRTLWLDFDGGGYTIKDNISGRMTQGWRLAMSNPTHLGRVTVDGKPQFITRLQGEAEDGIEVRRGAIRLEADSRLDKADRRLPVVGWNQDFQSVSGELNLPPGWRLLAANGVDKVPGTWLQRWTLLDLFLVLIAAVTTLRLWDWRGGLLALVTLGLVWHEPGAPQNVWLNILAAIALLRVLPANRLRTAVTWYRNASLLALVLIAIPFMIDQVRTGLYPQLERPGQLRLLDTRTDDRLEITELAAPLVQKQLLGAMKAQTAKPKPAYKDKHTRKLRSKMLYSPQQQAIDINQQIDPKAHIQTGPGIPNWRWTRIPLSWSGPVKKDQTMSLVLLSPASNMILQFIQILLLLALALFLSGVMRITNKGIRLGAPVLMAALLAGNLLALTPSPAQADIPTPEILKTLKERLLAPPECLPQCAQIPRLQLQLSPHTLSARMEIHTQEAVAVPLPGHAKHWLPTEVLVDGKMAQGLFRKNGGLWLQLAPGRHQILMAGPLPQRNNLELPLPLRPHHVRITTKGWSVDGVHENGLVDQQLQLTRSRGSAPRLQTLQSDTLPPFVRVVRTLHLGLDWRLETRVVRASPKGAAILLEVPLLGKESVTTDGVRIKDGKVLVNMSAGQTRMVWHSTLEKQDSLTLTAADTSRWVEQWRLDVSPIWHPTFSGIPVVHHQNRGQWLPTWQPWPGESITLKIHRPQGVDGRTLTIDSSQLSVEPGLRATDLTLNFSLRSSQGGQHTITIPEGTQLQSVTINSRPQPIRQDGNKITLPVVPGSQRVVLKLRSDQGIKTGLTTPAIHLGAASVNHRLHLTLPRDRWVLFVGGPDLGPAVLFWGVLIVLVLLAWGLGRIPLTPLKHWHWLLLLIGLSQVPVWTGATVVAWLLVLGMRARLDANIGQQRFDLMQITIVLLTVLALLLLFNAVKQGLLGTPDMQIAGNGSHAFRLNWYQDRSGETLPTAWVASVPLFIYRFLMLAWALWLAFALLRWLRWGWECFATNGLWRKVAEKKTTKKTKKGVKKK
ncbi:MAG: hypothetical protein GXP09_07435 [Gammaproteobacteria bacterium]|nr:hypothetical protein [Gammaproteobacteria bacterium]